MTPQPDPASPHRWPTALTILVLLAAFCAGLLMINATAENVPGRRIAEVQVASTPGAPFETATVPYWHCCSTEPIIVRTTLDAETAAARDPAVLIVSAHDNARLYVDGALTGGEGPSAGDPTNWSRRPRLIRIPPPMAHAGAVLDIEVQRGVGFGHLRPIYVGEYDALYPSYIALRVLRADMHVATGIIAAFVAAFCFAAASLLGARGLMFALGGLAASWALQVIGLSPSDPPWNGTVSNGIYFTGYLGTSVFLLWFFIEWTSVFAEKTDDKRRLGWLTAPWPRTARRWLGLASIAVMVIGTALIAVALYLNPPIGSQNVDRVCGWLGLAVIAFCLVRVVSYYRRTGFRDPFEASAFIFVLIAAVADIIMVRFFFIYGVSLGAAVIFFPLALLLSLAARARGVFEAATATAEKLNVLVAERERVIVSNMAEIQRNERAAMLLEERSRIMRDMHDGIGGQILGLILQARSRKLSDEALVSGLEQSLDDLRLVVDSLEQGEGSLTGALGAFRARIEPRCLAAGVELDWEIEDVGATPNIGPDKTLQIYRILLEACTNALKHGRPTRIGVSLKRNGEGIEIGLLDDGGGFDELTTSAGRGLANMRTRAQQVGAALVVTSGGGGTQISLKLTA
jgi:two-component system sensor histidine kinase UhpB